MGSAHSKFGDSSARWLVGGQPNLDRVDRSYAHRPRRNPNAGHGGGPVPPGWVGPPPQDGITGVAGRGMGRMGGTGRGGSVYTGSMGGGGPAGSRTSHRMTGHTHPGGSRGGGSGGGSRGGHSHHGGSMGKKSKKEELDGVVRTPYLKNAKRQEQQQG
ncbi:MAG: hypothetical protein L6R41_006374 [Letrouitia leprolyta]|nr:MAG: hypothetical protein L6R41_006374 [Letrouitia leprolyta]